MNIISSLEESLVSSFSFPQKTMSQLIFINPDSETFSKSG